MLAFVTTTVIQATTALAQYVGYRMHLTVVVLVPFLRIVVQVMSEMLVYVTQCVTLVTTVLAQYAGLTNLFLMVVVLVYQSILVEMDGIKTDCFVTSNVTQAITE